MKDISEIRSEEFETLLRWLSEDREKAGEIYLEIRDGLVRFFRFKGCSDTQTLADDTINRVAAKAATFDNSKNFKKITVFYGFASNVFHEYLRNQKREREKSKIFSSYQQKLSDYNEELQEAESECLSECLQKLTTEERTIFIEYYLPEKGKKSELRTKIAVRLQCEKNSLHVRIFRLRAALAKCIKNCLKKK